MDRVHLRNARAASRLATEEVIAARHHTSAELGEIDERIDRLSLLCEAMWSLLAERTDLTEDDLARRILELDGTDGQHDLRRRRTSRPCPCGAQVPPTTLSCQYCGEPVAVDTPFDVV